jgi:uncharacterized protein YifE (UPF0438 family)
MSGGTRTLAPWDLTLLDRHLGFYSALASGARQPKTALQAHFVAAARGHTGPVTQHEIAFHRFQAGWRDPRFDRACSAKPETSSALMSGRAYRVERSVDLADMAQLDGLAFRAGQTFRRIRGLYVAGSATARRASSDAAVWISTALADADLAHSLEGWTSDKFGDLSNVYTKALDGEFVHGLQAGAAYVSPWLHRLFDGRHTPAAAWRAVRSALPDDMLAEEVVGWLRALGSDFVTIVGLPITQLTPADYARLEAFVCGTFGVTPEWLNDALYVNAVEGLQFAAGCVPLVAAAMGWGPSDAYTFARLAGSLGVGSVVAANPIMLLLALLLLARAHQMSKTDGARGLWRPMVDGGAPTGTALGVAAAIGGPPLFGIAAGLVVAAGLRTALRGRSGIERSRWVEEPAARIASAISILQGIRDRLHPAPDGPQRSVCGASALLKRLGARQ